LSREVAGKIRPEILEATHAVAFCVIGAIMQMHPKMTKEDARLVMRELQDRRERASPQHHSPSWVNAYWRRIAA